MKNLLISLRIIGILKELVLDAFRKESAIMLEDKVYVGIDYGLISMKLIDSKNCAITSCKHGIFNWFYNIKVQFLPPIDYCLVSNDVNFQSCFVEYTVVYNKKSESEHFP